MYKRSVFDKDEGEGGRATHLALGVKVHRFQAHGRPVVQFLYIAQERVQVWYRHTVNLNVRRQARVENGWCGRTYFDENRGRWTTTDILHNYGHRLLDQNKQQLSDSL